MTEDNLFEALQTHDLHNERRIFWSEIAIIAIVALLLSGYLVAMEMFRHAIV